jgi:hypothetical protein
MLLGGLMVMPASAATEDEIEQSIVDGLIWLAAEQNVDGSWGDWDQVAMTGLVLVKLQERAYELDYPSPFDENYEYSDHIIKGWEYIFVSPGHTWQEPLTLQDHTAGASGSNDDPDTNGNGYGVAFSSPFGGHTIYATGICLMALAASGTPDRLNDGGLDFDSDLNIDTFKEIAQDTADFLAFAQGDTGNDEGGWGYDAIDNGGGWTDQSNSGYAVLGLAYAEGFDCTVPDWVSTELNVWIDTIQDPVDGDANDGGSYYNPDWLPGNPMVNELKAGNLIFEMTFAGDDPSTARFQAALDYIERHWRDANQDPGWGYSVIPANYQAMYCLMKGLGYSDVRLLDTDSDSNRDDDWLNQEPPVVPTEDLSSVIVAQQNGDGSWPSSYGSQILGTVWALLTLEFIFPDITPPEVWCVESVNPHGKNIPPAGSTTLPGPKGGKNEDGFYQLFAVDNQDPEPRIMVGCRNCAGLYPGILPFGPFPSGTVIKFTEAPGAIPSMKKIGSDKGQASSVAWHITLPGEPVVFAIDASGNWAAFPCFVPPPPK